MSDDRLHRSPRADARVAETFERIRSDRSRGARALAGEALRVLSRWVENWGRAPDAGGPETFRQTARLLEGAQPAMGPFLRWAAEWRRMARSVRAGRRVGAARSWIRREQARLRNEPKGLARTSRRRFPRVRRIVTLSRSESVLTALRATARTRPPVQVRVLESLPGGEGRPFAADVRRSGRWSRVIPDREGAAAVTDSDLLLIGADAVFSDGSVVHKVGTRKLALAAVRAGVPVVVVAGRSKFTGRPPPRRRLPAAFDRTPSRCISEFWTDQGAVSGGASRRLRPRGVPL